MTWDPDVYARYRTERDRPFFDLVDHIGATPTRVVDLGCGDGHLTRTLVERWPDAEVVGVDSAPEMLRHAETDTPRLRFECADIATWQPGRTPDLILSNAALHWLPDHDTLLARLVELLAPGGTLAVQMPANHDAPAHQAVRRTAADPPFRGRFPESTGAVHVLAPPDYLRLLRRLGCHADLWTTTYHHVLPAPDGILRWLEGTTLRPYLARLDDAAAGAFREALQARLVAAYPPRERVQLFPFRRLFFVARKGG